MKYECNHCNYSTDDRGNWSRHRSTKRHRLNTMETDNEVDAMNSYDMIMQCQFCSHTFSRKSALMRHYKTCPLKNERELLMKINHLEETIKNLNDDKAQMHADNVHLQELSQSANNVALQSMSALKFLTKNYKPDELIPYDPDLLQGDTDDDDFIGILVLRQRHKQLHKFIGDAIIAYYQKENPKDQSLWSSDISRLNYIISEVYDGKQRWVIDKNALRIRDIIIKPTLKKLDATLISYATKKDIRNMNAEDTATLLRRRYGCIEIHKRIESREIENTIMAYITPQFYLNKTSHNTKKIDIDC